MQQQTETGRYSSTKVKFSIILLVNTLQVSYQFGEFKCNLQTKLQYIPIVLFTINLYNWYPQLEKFE